MGDLEERVQAERLGEVGAQATEHVVVEEDITLDLFCQALDRAGIGEAELRAPGLEGVVCIGHGPGYRVVAQNGQRMTRRGSHGRHCSVGRGRWEDVRSSPRRKMQVAVAGALERTDVTKEKSDGMDKAVSSRRLEGGELTSIKPDPPIVGCCLKNA